MGKINQSNMKSKKIGWLDMLLYRLFRWRWDRILKSHPGMLKGLYDSMGASLDANYPGLREKRIDWQTLLNEASTSSKKRSELQLVVDNTVKNEKSSDLRQ